MTTDNTLRMANRLRVDPGAQTQVGPRLYHACTEYGALHAKTRTSSLSEGKFEMFGLAVPFHCSQTLTTRIDITNQESERGV